MSIDQIATLFENVSDPKKFKSHMLELTKATKDADSAYQKQEAKAAEARKAIQQAVKEREDADRALARYETEKAEMEAQRVVLNDRVQAVQAKEDAAKAAQAEADARLKQADEREQGIKEREATLADKERAFAQKMHALKSLTG